MKTSHDITLLLAHQAVTSRLNMLRENKHARTTGLLAKTLPKNLLIFFFVVVEGAVTMCYNGILVRRG